MASGSRRKVNKCLVDEALSAEILLHISRMLDKDSRTLSIRRLAKLAKQDPTLQAAIEHAIEDASRKAAFAKDWRDNRIAHLNRDHALNRNATPLKRADREAFDGALDAITKALGVVETHYCGTEPTTFAHVAIPGNADVLIDVLRDGVKARDRWLKGQPEGTEA
jgi:hypothetical protein